MKINVRQTSHDICDLFENLLYKHRIMIPDEDREGEEEACIYGMTYSELEDGVTEILANLLNETKRKDLELETDSYNFNKEINGVYYVDEPKIDKYAVKIQEVLNRTVIVDACNYEDAERQVHKAYHDDDLRLYAEHCVDMEISDATDIFINIYGKEEFSKMPQTEEITINKSRPAEFEKEEES